jgi:hypothetical protein
MDVNFHRVVVNSIRELSVALFTFTFHNFLHRLIKGYTMNDTIITGWMVIEIPGEILNINNIF